MGEVPKVVIMKNQPLIRPHWEMIDCLMGEVHDRKGALHGRDLLYSLFRDVACYDARFNAYGFIWNHQRGYMQFTAADGEVYVGEAAIAAFLGLEMKTLRGRWEPGHTAVSIIYKRFADHVEAYRWIRWQVLKMDGHTDKVKALKEPVRKVFPQISQKNNELQPEKD